MELSVFDLAVARGGVTVLSGIGFRVAAGQALVVRGPNGIGKTTLLRTLAGLQPALSGKVSLPPEEMAYAGHADAVKSMLTVAENLTFWAEVYGGGDIAPALRALELDALGQRLAQCLSAGQKRRLGLARLILTGRCVWLMDEPTVSLDTASVALFGRVLRGHLAAGGMALVASHIDLGQPEAQVLDLTAFRADRRGPQSSPSGFDEAFNMIALLKRDLRLAVRAGGGFGLGLVFFLIVTMLVPFGVGPEAKRLASIAPGILWVGALLASLLSLDRIFALDHEDGTLEVLATAPIPLEAVVGVKALAHWLTTGLPLTLAAPFLGVLLQLPAPGHLWLFLSLLAGTPALSVIGSFGAALTVGLKRGGLLLSLLVLPLYVPTLIFGAEATRRGAEGQAVLTPLVLLLGITLATLAALPYAAAAAIRVNLR